MVALSMMTDSETAASQHRFQRNSWLMSGAATGHETEPRILTSYGNAFFPWAFSLRRAQ